MHTPDFRVKLVFHGILARELCEELDAAVSTPFEAIKLIEANRPGTANRLFARGHYVMLLNGEIIDNKAMYSDLREGDEIQFVPVVAGAIFGIILGIIAVVLAVTALVLAFTKPPVDDLAGDSTSFLSPTNVTREGGIVPVVYGTTRIGSLLVSDNTFLGRSSGTTSEATTYPFINDNDRIFGSNPRFEPDEGIGGSTAPAVVESDVSTSQQIHVLGEGRFSDLTPENILFNGTPLETAGQRNFKNVKFSFRAGSDPQTLAPWVTVSAAPVSPAINTKLTTNRTVTTLNDELDAVRVLLSVGSFFETKKKKPSGTTVQIRIEKRETGTGPWTTVSQPLITGEYFSQQQFQYEIELDNTKQWDIAVSRVTAEENTEEKQNTVQYENAIEIKKDQVTYDGTAICALEFTNEAFGEGSPEIEFIPDGKIIRIPSNYDPVTRIYTGVWDGTYTTGFSNNPAFCAQDIIEDDVYGLGEHLSGAFDKFNIFALGQFCDVFIDDGQGGTEPRYTLNVILNKRKEAFKVLRDVASVFRGSAIWDGSQVVFFTEQSLSVTRILNNTQVIDGDFTYQGPSTNVTPNSVTVSFLDKDNQYEKSSVTYKEHDKIRTFGLNEKSFEGVGTTSQGQALRLAKYMALTDGLAMSCRAVEDQADILPGEVTAVFDEKFMGASDRQGRVSSATPSTTTTVHLNRSFTVESGRTYQLYVVLPDKSVEIKGITNAVGSHTAITLDSALTAAPQAEAAWGISADNLGPQFYINQSRKNTDARTGGSNGDYNLAFLTYDPNKLTIIEDEINFDQPPTTTNPNVDTVPPPDNLAARVDEFSDVNGTRYNIVLTWDRPEGDLNITGYDVFYTYNQDTLQTLATNKANPTVTFRDALEGEYAFFVRTRTLFGQSDFETIGVLVDDSTSLLPGRVIGLELFGQGNDTVFQHRDAKFTWRYVSDLGAQEIGSERFGADSVFQDDTFKEFVVDIYDTDTDTRVRREEGVLENEYIYTLEKNLEDGGPRRQFRVEVFYRNKFNNASEPTKLTVSNPAPPVPDNLNVGGTAGGVLVSFTATENLIDLAGYKIWGSTTPGFTPGPSTLIEDTTSTTVVVAGEAGVTQYIKVAQYDTYSKDVADLNISGELFATPIDKLDTTPPATPSGLSLDTDVSNATPGTQAITITATWNRNTEDDMNFYDVGIREGTSGDYITTGVPQVGNGDTPTHVFTVDPNTVYQVRVRAIDDAGNKSAYTANSQITSAADSIAPGTPTGLTATGTFQSIVLSWTNPTDADFLATRVYENTVDDFGTATLIAEGSLDFFVRDELTTGVTRHYWLTAVDTSGNESSETASVSASTQTVVTLDIEPLNITEDLIGLDAITETKIQDDAITTPKIAAGAVTANEILANTITANEIAANTVTAAEIAALTITADELAANSVISSKIIAGAVTTDKMTVGSIDADRLQAGTILAPSITVSGTPLSDTTSRADDPIARSNSKTTQLLPGLVNISGSTTLSDWRNGSDNTKIEGGSIAANTVTANIISVGSRNISIDELQFEPNDPSSNRVSWTSGTITYTDDSGSVVTQAISAGNSSTTTSTRYIYWVKGASTLSQSTDEAVAFGANNIVLATYRGGVDLVANYGRTILDGSQLITNSITSSNLVTGQAVITESAQIAAAIVDTAQIATAAITNAKIGDLEVDTIKIANASVTQIATTATTSDRTVTNAEGEVLLGTTGLTPINPGNSVIVMTVTLQLKDSSSDYIAVRVRGHDGAGNTGDIPWRIRQTVDDVSVITYVIRFGQANTTGPYKYGITAETAGSSIVRDSGRVQVVEWIK
jgi:predicted phage tail protein